MRKTTLFMLLILVVFSNCKKKSNDEPVETYEKKPVPVTISSTSSKPAVFDLSNILNYNYDNYRNSNSATTQTYEYDEQGRTITKVTATNGTDTVVKDYYYNDRDKGLLDSIVSKYNGNFNGVDVYTISNDKVEKIEKYNENRSLDKRIGYHYNGDKVDTITIYDTSGGTPQNGSGQVTYSGDNVSSLFYSIGGVTVNLTITYDNKNAINLNVKTIENPLTSSNNVASLTQTITAFGQFQTISTNFTYTYNSDNYPTQVTATNSYGSTNTTVAYEDK